METKTVIDVVGIVVDTILTIALILASVHTARRWGEVSAFEKQQKVSEELRLKQQLNLVDVLLGALGHLRTIARHNAGGGGGLILFPCEVWESAFFRSDAILPPDRELLENVSELLIRADLVNTRIRWFYSDKGPVGGRYESIVELCRAGESPYNLPSILDSLETELKRLRRRLTA